MKDSDGQPAPQGRQTPQDDSKAGQQRDEAQPGRGINQAGFIKDKEAPTSDSYGNTRDSGEG